MAAHCEVTGLPVRECDCGACDEPDEAPELRIRFQAPDGTDDAA